MNEVSEILIDNDPLVKKLVLTPGQAFKFNAKVDKNGPLPDQTMPFYQGLKNCWNWKARLAKDGYGLFKLNKRVWRVHRLMVSIEVRELLKDECVCHKCDNKICVNPDHLWIGTKSENTKDRDRKGRLSRPLEFEAMKANPDKVSCGEKHPVSKITLDQVFEIRRRYRAGEGTQKALGKDYNLGQSQVCRIINEARNLWKRAFLKSIAN